MPRWRVETGDATAFAGVISTFRMSEPTQQFLEQTRRFWQKHTDRPLSLEDARQIAANVAGLFQILAEWAAADKQGQSAPEREAGGK